MERSIAYVQDVGPSYGFAAVAAYAWGPLLLVPAAVWLAASPTFTNVGHLLAVVLGGGLAEVSIRRAAVTRRGWRTSTGSGTSGD